MRIDQRRSRAWTTVIRATLGLAVASLVAACALTERVVPTPPLTPPPDPPAGTAWHDSPGEAFRAQLGRNLEYVCPPDGGLSSIWGTDIYTDDSSVCTAAVHAGFLTREVGGRVRITVLAGRESYRGSLRNGVVSDEYGPWAGSFSIV